jgi:proteasome lid subunit RPN8/RPN11
MIQLLLPLEVQAHLVRELRKAGKRETGGLLLGEHLGDNLFKIVGVTVQAKSGAESHFIRDPTQHASQLETFFREHVDDYLRFNYLGEWHSHPSFDVHPSGPDLLSMSELVGDSTVGVNFAVLLIVRLDSHKQLFSSATLCQTGSRFTSAQIYAETDTSAERRPFSRNQRARSMRSRIKNDIVPSLPGPASGRNPWSGGSASD